MIATHDMAHFTVAFNRSGRHFFSANGSSMALGAVYCPIAVHSTFLALVVTGSKRSEALVAGLVQRLEQRGIPWMAFSDPDAKPPLIPLELNVGSCSYDQLWRKPHVPACDGFWRGNPNGEPKFLSALLAASVVCAGRFDWLLIGDGDTFWCPQALHAALASFTPGQEALYFAGGRLDFPPTKRGNELAAQPWTWYALTACQVDSACAHPLLDRELLPTAPSAL